MNKYTISFKICFILNAFCNTFSLVNKLILWLKMQGKYYLFSLTFFLQTGLEKQGFPLHHWKNCSANFIIFMEAAPSKKLFRFDSYFDVLNGLPFCENAAIKMCRLDTWSATTSWMMSSMRSSFPLPKIFWKSR